MTVSYSNINGIPMSPEMICEYLRRIGLDKEAAELPVVRGRELLAKLQQARYRLYHMKILIFWQAEGHTLNVRYYMRRS